QEVNDYMHWYRTDRIKTTLGGLSPLEYRRRMGVAV
ncbi:MAG: IS3 family transposase, partial [Lachnospiraceae bacterium]|nr:IS3 family transposase [Lachnospiraceae bacterium]